MTDRGLPIVDGAPACPFVAFEDDRDGRALAPDHQHRCFAEPRPAPRALAHQEAYCLSSAFPVCPTFQDWARREAAAARPAASQAHQASGEPPVSRPLPPMDRDEYRVSGTDTPPPIPPRRNLQRDWAAPPPWSGDPAAAPVPPESRGLAGSAADRLAGPDPADPLSPRPDPAPSTDHDLDTDHATPDDAARYSHPAADDAAALAGAAAIGASAAAASGSGSADARSGDDLDEPDWAQDDRYAAGDPGPRYAAPASRQPVSPGSGDGRRPPAPNPHDQVRRQTPQEASDIFGPAWERPHRYEAYPSLKTRVGLPGLGGIGRVGAAALGLVLAALALFFVGPMLLGIGGPDSGPAGGAATATPIVEVTPIPEPTVPPAPTPQVYVVAKGDTISKIAKKYKLTIDQVLAANPQIKNPNKISIGDEITIPVPEVESDGGAGASAEP